MKIKPQAPELSEYIDYYWIINRGAKIFGSSQMVRAFPGTTPELTLFLNGHISYKYSGEEKITNRHLLSGHIDHEFQFKTEALNRIVVIVFKSRSLASLLPFINVNPQELMKKPLCYADQVFDQCIDGLVRCLKNLGDQELVDQLDEWLMCSLDINHSGFITELYHEISSSSHFSDEKRESIKMFREITGYSYSTLERYFKKETGLTPKKYESLVRYKSAVEEIYDSQSNDWMYYVDKYGYYDQSHFIKEIKKYTGFTPVQLLTTPGLRTYRPREI